MQILKSKDMMSNIVYLDSWLKKQFEDGSIIDSTLSFSQSQLNKSLLYLRNNMLHLTQRQSDQKCLMYGR